MWFAIAMTAMVVVLGLLWANRKEKAALVVYATTRGRARELAKRIERALSRRRKCRLIDASAEDADPWEMLLNEEARDVVVVVSTAQGGLPPASAKRVFDELEDLANDFRVGAAALRGHRFAVLGLGSSAYVEFCVAAKNTDKALRKLGAVRVGCANLDDTREEERDKFSTFLVRTVKALSSTKPPKQRVPKVVDVKKPPPSTKTEKSNDVEDLAMVTSRQAANLKKEGYKLIGSHSAVKMCRWTKHQLRGRGGCYKHTFYGITSSQCMEATPSLACANKCVFCVAAGSLVDLDDGTSMAIEEITPGRRVLALHGDGLVPQEVVAATDSGIRRCVRVELSDGRRLSCTPDHRIHTSEGWIEAGRLRRGDRVTVSSVDFPKIPFDGGPWSLDLTKTLGSVLNLKTPEHSRKSAAFARVCGWLYSSRHLGHRLDVDALTADVVLLTGEPITVVDRGGDSFRVDLPSRLEKSRSPFAKSAECPVFLIREFLGGVFGGMAPEDCASQLATADLEHLSLRCGVERPLGRRRQKLLPTQQFAATIGFRYNFRKQLQLKLSSSSAERSSWPTRFETVSEVTDDGRRRVYDLSVPLFGVKDGSFTANGIVVHNCWRHHTNPVGREWKWLVDDPVDIVQRAVDLHVGMIKEAKGVPGVLVERWREAHTVRHCALSLVGEPIMYPRINELIGELHARKISTFLVTNAQFPQAIKNLVPVTQLYVSVDAANEKSLIEIDRPLFSDAWRRLRRSMEYLREKRQRTVARLTIVKGYNEADLKGYAELVALGAVTLVEIKGVTFCGNSPASNLTMESCPWYHEILEFGNRLLAELRKLPDAPPYDIACAHQHSVSVLLARADLLRSPSGEWRTWIDYDEFNRLVASGADFGVQDYAAPTPAWALLGSPEQGFDPADTRLYKKKKNGKSR